MYDFKLSKVAALRKGLFRDSILVVFLFCLLAKACGILVLEQEENLAPYGRSVALITARLQGNP